MRSQRVATMEIPNTNELGLSKLQSAKKRRETRSQLISSDDIAGSFPTMHYQVWKHRHTEGFTTKLNRTSDIASEGVYSDDAAGSTVRKVFHDIVANADYDALPLEQDASRNRSSSKLCHSTVSLTSSLTREKSAGPLHVSTSAGESFTNSRHDSSEAL